MRNPVAKNDYNRAAVHPDRSKSPHLTVEEGLLDWYAENAQDVAESVYDNNSVRLFIDGKEIEPVDESVFDVKCSTLSEEDMKTRTLRVEFTFTPTPGMWADFIHALAQQTPKR